MDSQSLHLEIVIADGLPYLLGIYISAEVQKADPHAFFHSKQALCQIEPSPSPLLFINTQNMKYLIIK